MVGQCGNQIGTSFWDLLTAEHGLNEKGFVKQEATADNLQGINVFYNHCELKENYMPRAVLVDLDPLPLFVAPNKVVISDLYRPENIINGKNGTGNNWARGHFTEGVFLKDKVLEAVRKECEQCDCFESFQMVHSLGGGTGSGLGTLLLSNLRDEYPDRFITSYSIMSSPKIPETVVEPYNAILSFRELLKSTDATFCIDNEALCNICRKTLSVSTPDFTDLNELVSLTMSGVSATVRFKGRLSVNMKKIMSNMLPFPRLHFLMPGFAPLSARNVQEFTTFTVSQLAQQMFDDHNMLIQCDPKRGKYLTAKAVFRGHMSMKEVCEQMKNVRNKNSEYFIDNITQNLGVTLCSVPPRGLTLSGTFIGNSTSIKDIFYNLTKQFTAMFQKKAFLHWFVEEGMELAELTEAENTISDLIAEYQVHERGSLPETPVQPASPPAV